MALLFLLPAAVAGLAYWTLWRGLDLGGGPPYSIWQVLIADGSLSIGGPVSGWGATVPRPLSPEVAPLAVLAIAKRSTCTPDRFFLVAILIPIVHALAIRPPFLFPRYFLMSVRLHPVGPGGGACQSVSRPPLGKMGLRGRPVWRLIATNTLWTGRLVTLGRGQYLAALNFMARTTDDPTLTISSDHNFGVRKLIEFYSPMMPSRPAIQYFNGDQWPPCGPRWLILHRYAESDSPLPLPRLDVDGHHFRWSGCSIAPFCPAGNGGAIAACRFHAPLTSALA